MNDSFNLSKRVEQVEFVLSKQLGVQEIPRDINVSLILDYSASMSTLYLNGNVQLLLERILGISNTIDDDGLMELVLFSNTAHHYGTLSSDDYTRTESIISEILSKYYMATTSYSEGIKKTLEVLNNASSMQVEKQKPVGIFGQIANFFKGKSEEVKQPINIDTDSKVVANKQLLIMITDGYNDTPDNEKFYKVVKEIEQSDNIYLQFISLGLESQVLQELADKSPSVGYSAISSLDISDEDLIRSAISLELLEKFKDK